MSVILREEVVAGRVGEDAEGDVVEGGSRGRLQVQRYEVVCIWASAYAENMAYALCFGKRFQNMH